MLQYQGSPYREEQQDFQGYPRSPQTAQNELQENSAYGARDAAIASKWWHVPDGEIEQMIRRLNNSGGLKSSQGNTHRRPSALRNGSISGGTPFQQSVRFNSSPLEEPEERRGPPEEPEDALDQVLRQQGGAYGNYREPVQKKRGAWKVPDDALLQFIDKAKQVLDKEAQHQDSPMPISRTMLRDSGGSMIGSHHPSASGSVRSGATLRRYDSSPQLGRRSVSKPGSVRSRISDLSERPVWAKCHSLPNIFAPVGSGLDGKGNKLISGSNKFRETPIFLSDATDKCLENVRVAVCGHPHYMQRR